MGIIYNAEEVLSMAVQLEENAGKFYRKAASLRQESDPSAAALFSELAGMEAEHVAFFTSMKDEVAAELGTDNIFDPYLDASPYLNAVADAYGGEGAPDVTEAMTGKETVAEILRTAIDLEGSAILFYMGIKDMVPDEKGKVRMDDIIAEEKRHLVNLSEQLRQHRDT